MIGSDTVVNMGFGSVMHFCLQIIIPFIVYIISITYVSDEQSDWFNKLQTNFDGNIIKGNKGLFFGTIAFILTGIVSVLTITHKQNLFLYKNIAQENGMSKSVDSFFDSLKTNTEFILFPIMIMFSCLGLVIGYQNRTMLPHVIMSSIAVAMNLYLIFSFGTRVSVTAAALLIPLLVWQIANIVLYWNTNGAEVVTDRSASGNNNTSSTTEDEEPASGTSTGGDGANSGTSGTGTSGTTGTSTSGS